MYAEGIEKERRKERKRLFLLQVSLSFFGALWKENDSSLSLFRLLSSSPFSFVLLGMFVRSFARSNPKGEQGRKEEEKESTHSLFLSFFLSFPLPIHTDALASVCTYTCIESVWHYSDRPSVSSPSVGRAKASVVFCCVVIRQKFRLIFSPNEGDA